VRERLERGRDRLLERSSYRPDRAAPLLREIGSIDGDPALEDLVIRMLEHHGVDVDEIAPRTYRLEHARSAHAAFPGIPPDGLTATFARERALAREDSTFLSWEHPIAQAAADMLIGSEAGNASFATIEDPEDRTLLLEACFVVECVAPPALGVDRFLPPTPVRHAVDQALAPRDDRFAPGELGRASPDRLLGRPEIAGTLLPRMLVALEERAESDRERLAAAARDRMVEVLGREIERLELLRATGGRVTEEEIALARLEVAELREALGAARVRLDSLRLVWKGPRALLDGR
jgi:ATP-dependent helicase HepA